MARHAETSETLRRASRGWRSERKVGTSDHAIHQVGVPTVTVRIVVGWPAVTEGRRDRLELVWFLAVMTWSLVRITAVGAWLQDYGVNPWHYAAVDLGSSAPYSLASARLLGALVDGRNRAAVPWGALTLVTFLAPDIYIFAAGRALPWPTYVVVGSIVVIGGTLAVRHGQATVFERRLALETEPAGEPLIAG